MIGVRGLWVIAIALGSVASGRAATSPVQANGPLHVQGTDLLNRNGEPVQLRGVATHGLQWFNTFYSDGAAFEAAADEWGADVIRLTLYLSEDGYLTSTEISKEQFEAMLDSYIQVCVRKGIYVILDWHVHKPGFPGYYLTEAKSFFSRMSAKYGRLPNLIWEICNEPSEASLTEAQSGQAGVTDPGHYVTWTEIADYAKTVIPLIKANNPDAVILVGTPSWSTLGASTKGAAAWKEIAANKLAFSNVLYVIHYYAASHSFQDVFEAASHELPLFSTEWAAAGFQETSSNDPAKGQAWVDMLRRRKISWCYWNYSNGTPGIFATFDHATTALGPFSPSGSNVTPTGRLLYRWLSEPADDWFGVSGNRSAFPAIPAGGESAKIAFSRNSGGMVVSLSTGASGRIRLDVRGKAVGPTPSPSKP